MLSLRDGVAGEAIQDCFDHSHAPRGNVALGAVPHFLDINKYVNILTMKYSIDFYSETVRTEIESLPSTLSARFITLADRMETVGPNLGEPHTKAFGDGLFELRLKGAEGIARVFYCTLVGRRIVMLHSFVKKSQKILPREMRIAEIRMKEVKNGC